MKRSSSKMTSFSGTDCLQKIQSVFFEGRYSFWFAFFESASSLTNMVSLSMTNNVHELLKDTTFVRWLNVH